MIKMKHLIHNYGSSDLLLSFYNRKAGELGLLAPTVSEEYGGGGMDAVSFVIIHYHVACISYHS